MKGPQAAIDSLPPYFSRLLQLTQVSDYIEKLLTIEVGQVGHERSRLEGLSMGNPGRQVSTMVGKLDGLRMGKLCITVTPKTNY